MKIVFLCGSLEPGRDGVGDYTRRLAGELTRKSHQVLAIALNDKYLDKNYKGNQEIDGVLLPVLRVTSKWSIRKRFIYAKEWIDAFDPEWISLQFVPYSFHVKGLPFLFIYQLKKLLYKRKLHIMFHETWIGSGNGTSWKVLLLSTLQKAIIKQMVRLLKPLIAHTHLPVYSLSLHNLGIKVKSLPLFSNISVVATPGQSSFEQILFRIGFFSQIGVNNEIIAFITELYKQIAHKKMQFEILLIGGRETQMAQFRKAIEDIDDFKDKVRYTGFLKEEELSLILEGCTLGVTPVPRHGLGKSGSVAAFLAHGVPVAAPIVHPGFEPQDIGFFLPELCSSVLLKPDYDLLQQAKKTVHKVRDEISISTITNKFLSDISI